MAVAFAGATAVLRLRKGRRPKETRKTGIATKASCVAITFVAHSQIARVITVQNRLQLKDIQGLQGTQG